MAMNPLPGFDGILLLKACLPFKKPVAWVPYEKEYVMKFKLEHYVTHSHKTQNMSEM